MLNSLTTQSVRMISQTAEHALRAVGYLARQGQGATVPAAEIAHMIGAPANYLGKTLQTLARHGVVSGSRGPTGGFRLIEDPATLTVGQIARLFADAPRQKMCLMGGRPCSAVTPCVAHHRWSAMQQEATKVLDDTTVAQLMGCEVEVSAAGASEHRTARVAV